MTIFPRKMRNIAESKVEQFWQNIFKCIAHILIFIELCFPQYFVHTHAASLGRVVARKKSPSFKKYKPDKSAVQRTHTGNSLRNAASKVAFVSPAWRNCYRISQSDSRLRERATRSRSLDPSLFNRDQSIFDRVNGRGVN